MKASELFLVLLRRLPALAAAALLIIPAPFSASGAEDAAKRAMVTDLDTDERVEFFPTAAYRDPATGRWIVPVHGWIYEPEDDSLSRQAFIGVLRRSFGLEPESPERELFDRRVRRFLVDNERRQRIPVRVGARTVELPASAPSGHFEASFELDDAEARALASGEARALTSGEARAPASAEARAPASAEERWLAFQALTRSGDERRFTGRALLLAPTGVSVISDIDDTVKVSHVRDKARLARATFLEPFVPVPGMAEAYRAWRAQGAAFHYVSSSPWQLCDELSSFLAQEGFPQGTMHLKRFRWKEGGDAGIANLLAPGTKTKPKQIEPLLRRFPGRRFVLVGDSGEVDPEVYGELARAYPGQVLHIFIRNVTGEQPGDERFQKAFQGVAADRWTLFDDPRVPGSFVLPGAARP